MSLNTHSTIEMQSSKKEKKRKYNEKKNPLLFNFRFFSHLILEFVRLYLLTNNFL